MADDDLTQLLGRVARIFPEEAPLSLAPPASEEAREQHADRFSGGHALRWFASCDGQAGALPFYDAHELCSLAEAVEAMRIADDIRAEPEGYWVEPHWLAIASDRSGHHLMIDDRDGRVLSVAHDDDHVTVLAPSPEAWLAKLISDRATGAVVHDPVFGLIEREVLARVEAHRRERQAREKAPRAPRGKLTATLWTAAAVAILLLVIWWLETHR